MKGRIFHLEDDPDWIEAIRELLETEYDLYQATSVEAAALMFVELAHEGYKCDLAIIDISLVFGDAHDKGGFRFTDALERTGILPGQNIVVLSAHPEADDNLRVAFRDYDVVDFYDKGDFVEEKAKFLELVAKVVKEAQETFS